MSALEVGIPCPMCRRAVPADATVCPHDGTSLLDETFVGDRLLGARLGAYQILERIGSGAMGFVYRAVQPEIGKQVAIKVLRPGRIEADGGVNRLLDEARAVNLVGHPGIVDIFAFGEAADGRPYIVMELLHGEPLDRLISPGRPLPLAEAVGLLDGIAAPLGAAHAAGISHGDLKPNNIFVTPRDDGSRGVKLLDFGLARRRSSGAGDSGVKPLTLAGTPRYLAPELVGGAPASPASDLYALGVIAYELLTGSNPFRAEDATECIRRHLEVSPEAPSTLASGVPKALDALVLELLAKNPSERPATAEAVRARLPTAEPAPKQRRAPRSKPPSSKPPPSKPPAPAPPAAESPGAKPSASKPPPSKPPTPSPPIASSSAHGGALVRDTVETGALAQRGWPRPATLALVVLLALVAGVSIFYVTLRSFSRGSTVGVEQTPAPPLPMKVVAVDRGRVKMPAHHPRRESRPARTRGVPSRAEIDARVQQLKQAFAARPDWWRSGHPRAIVRLQKILEDLDRDDGMGGRRWATSRLERWQRHFLPR